MAKGDFVEVHPLSGPPIVLVASRNGRRVEATYHKRSGIAWLVCSEVTRGGRPTGNLLSARLDQTVAVVENRAPRDVKETPRAKQVRQKGPKSASGVPPGSGDLGLSG